MPTVSDELSPAEKSVWDQEELYWRSLKERDAKTYLNLWDPRFVGWPYFVSAPLTKEGVEKQIVDANGRWATSSAVLNYTLVPLSVREYGDGVVIAIYRVTMRVAVAGTSPESDRINRILHTWKKTEHGWRIIGGMSDLEQQAQ